MIFKRIEVAGFKSFADKLNIAFNDGVTAIVGPNGCGKSNVADAIRWVLGEQSSKMLRGKNMQDVIFKGTQTRKSLSYCEVSLVFDNTTRCFNIDYDEVVITRKLYRSGDSEYLLNRAPVRLRDITDLLHDCGIGKEGYSIIGQGRIEQIVSSKPEDRRGIFEEAAGIAKFKIRKLEAERKLERTREYISRVNDIVYELEKQLGPLKKQSETAKTYLELMQQLKHNEINVYIAQYDGAEEQKAKINTLIQGLDEQIELRKNDIDGITAAYNASLDELSKADEELNKLTEHILELSLGIQKYEGDSNVVKERYKFLNEQNERAQKEIEESEKQRAAASQRIEQILHHIESQKGLISKLRKQEEELTDKYLEIVNQLTQSEDENQSANTMVIEALEKLTEIKANLSKLETEKAVANDLIASNNEKITSIKQKIKDNDGILYEISAGLDGVDKKRDSLAEIVENQKVVNEKNDINLKLLEKEIAELTTRKEVVAHRKNLISDMQADFEGYAGSVKRLLQDAQGKAEINKKIVGVVARLIKVPEKYETAIEIALGNAMQNVVTQNEDDAKKLIEHLKQNRFGRATFLPINSIKPRSIDPQFAKFLGNPSVCGVAKDLIEYDKSLDVVFAGLLGATVITEDLDSAVELAKATRYAFRIVTVEGDMINPAGSISGGSKKSEVSNLLSRDREIEKLTEELNSIKQTLVTKQNEFSKLNKEYIDGVAVYEEKARELRKLEIDNASVFEKRQRYIDFNERLNEEIKSYTLENEQAQIKIQFIDKEISSIDELENTVNNSRFTADESNKTRSAMFSNLKVQRDNYYDSATKIKIQIAGLESEITSQNAECDRLNEQIATLADKIETDSIILDKNVKAANNMLAMLEQTASGKELAEKQRLLAETKQKKADFESNKKILQESFKELEDQRSELVEELTQLKEKRSIQDFKLQKVDTDIQTMQDKIFEDYELVYQTCLPFKEADYDLTEGYKKVNALKKEISRLGPINSNAIEEYKAVGERYEGLKAELEDNTKTENELTTSIKELSGEMKTRFDDCFEQINTNFGKIFRELFGGGRAHLEILESDDPLEAGIEINAEPPGKKLSSMSLLSGGEKALTAIAILFAILKLRPMPFCLLDEIEAALDDANVGRFATYLKHFSKDTQFIVITHRKPTMELADSLYGVSMQEGVSRILSVNLAEAVKNVQTN